MEDETNSTSLDDLLRWDGSDGLYDDDDDENNNTDGLDHSDGIDDLELWALEQTLTTNPSSSSSSSLPATHHSAMVEEPDATNSAMVTTPATSAVVVEDDDSTSQEELSRLRLEHTQLQEQMKKQLQSSRAKPNSMVASTDDLLQRIHELELEHSAAEDRAADYLKTIQRLETRNQQLQSEHEQLKEESMKRMTHHNHNDNDNTLSSSSSVKDTTLSSSSMAATATTAGQVDPHEAHISDLKTVIENLQARIMVLVEEKLDLQLRNDRLEHEKKSPLKQSPHSQRWFAAAPATTQSTPKAEAVVVEQLPGIVEGEASQSDHLKQAMVEKQKRGGSLGGIMAKVTGAGDYVTSPVSVAGGNMDSLSLREKKAAQLEARGGDESLGLLTSPKKLDPQATGDEKHGSTKVVSPMKFSGWGSLFGSAKKKDSVIQGDEEDFMSTTTTTAAAAAPSTNDAPGAQLLLPALTSDSLPSMLDSNSVSSHSSVSRENLVDEDNTIVDVEDTIEFDGVRDSVDMEKVP